MTTIKIDTDAHGNVVMAFNGPDACGYFYSGGGGGGGGKPQTTGGGAVAGIAKKPVEKEPDIYDYADADKICREAAARIAELEAALSSIARNTCCDKCQEAALVARAALEGGKNEC